MVSFQYFTAFFHSERIVILGKVENWRSSPDPQESGKLSSVDKWLHGDGLPVNDTADSAIARYTDVANMKVWMPQGCTGYRIRIVVKKLRNKLGNCIAILF